MIFLKLKVLNSLKDAQNAYHVDTNQTQAKISELAGSVDEDEEDEDSQESEEAGSIVFSSDSK